MITGNKQFLNIILLKLFLIFSSPQIGFRTNVFIVSGISITSGVGSVSSISNNNNNNAGASTLPQLSELECGMNPIDMFLTGLFDILEKEEVESLDDPQQQIPQDKVSRLVDDNFVQKPKLQQNSDLTYAKLLYAFTTLPMVNYDAYSVLMRSLNIWNKCMRGSMKIKKSALFGLHTLRRPLNPNW